MSANPSNPNPAATGQTPGPTPPDAADRDVLVTRLLDGRAGESDWIAFRDLARHDETIWGEVILSRRQCTTLERAFEPALTLAELHEMPDLGLAGVAATDLQDRHRLGGGGGGGLVGWAIAATLALGFIAQQSGLLRTGMESRPGATGGVTAISPDAALQNYLDLGKQSGRVVGELPERKVVDVRPSPTGEGYDVLYYRQIIERTRVDSLYSIGASESGAPVLVPASAPVTGGSSF